MGSGIGGLRAVSTRSNCFEYPNPAGYGIVSAYPGDTFAIVVDALVVPGPFQLSFRLLGAAGADASSDVMTNT